MHNVWVNTGELDKPGAVRIKPIKSIRKNNFRFPNVPAVFRQEKTMERGDKFPSARSKRQFACCFDRTLWTILRPASKAKTSSEKDRNFDRSRICDSR